jgi:8-oxo-dGTP diphosphatase
VDWAPHPDEGDKVLWIFDGGTMETASLERLALEASEIAEARFWPTESFDSLMPERLARRLHLAVSALDSHLTLYAEHGAMPARRATL